jgi:hypothetical protein
MTLPNLAPALLLPLLLWQAPATDPLPTADPEVTRAELEHHVRFLASDELQGRGVCTSGSERAAWYLARALEAAGLEPAGEEGGYFQPIDVRRFEYPSLPRLLCTRESGEVSEAVYGVDFDLEIRGRARSTEKLPIRAFTALSYQKSLPSEPERGAVLYFAGTPNERKEALASRGLEDFSGWGLEVDVNLSAGGLEPGQAKEPPAPRVASGSAQADGCERVVLRGAFRADLEVRRFSALQLLVEERESPVVEVNVVARLPGAGTAEEPDLAQEAVVLSAHYDHLGLHRPRKEKNKGPDADLIFNGADDNASGCAALLELAQALAAGPRPARTLVFLFTSCEERGGHGSARYLGDPAHPLEKTVVDLNLEMLGRPDERAGGPGRLWLTGFERSNLGPALQEQGLAVVADPRPEQRFFQRSDNYAFALRGVVAQSLSSFDLHADYHEVSDEADTLDYGHLEAAARVALEATRLLASGVIDPRWVEGGAPRPLETRSEPAGQSAGQKKSPRPTKKKDE